MASTKPAITYEVVNRATGCTTDGMPVLHSTSTPVAVASTGARGRGDHSSATHAPTAQASAAHAAGPRTVANPQPSKASRSVVAAATGSRATASIARSGEYQRHRRGTAGGGGGGGGGTGRPARSRGGGGIAGPAGASSAGRRGSSTVAGSPGRRPARTGAD